MSCDRNICYAQDYNGGCETCPCNGENKTELVEDKQTLLNCPFCGGEAKIINYGFNQYSVGCSECSMETRRTAGVHSAVKVWNTRKPI